MFFLMLLLDDRRIQEAQKHKDPSDPDLDQDPQHSFSVIFVEFVKIQDDVDKAVVKD